MIVVVSYERYFQCFNKILTILDFVLDNLPEMGNILGRVLDGPIPKGSYDVEEYQKSLRKRRRVIFGSVSGSLLVIGFVVSGSVTFGNEFKSFIYYYKKNMYIHTIVAKSLAFH